MPVAKRRVRFGEAALEAGYIEKVALDKALIVQRERDQQGGSHKLLGIILLEMGAISNDQLIEILKTMNAAASGRLPKNGLTNGSNGNSANNSNHRRS
ncbi:MAG TPA: hypothetical protein VFF73_05255 [Planctomycetota bacterium]|nr:hypothetical protein [Planctomycetota bacterium]